MVWVLMIEADYNGEEKNGQINQQGTQVNAHACTNARIKIQFHTRISFQLPSAFNKFLMKSSSDDQAMERKTAVSGDGV